MKYVSIDLETTGLDSENCQILEFGAVIDDTDLYEEPKDKESNLFGGRPYFHCYVLNRSIVGEIKALSMNASIIEKIANREKYNIFKFVQPEFVLTDFNVFLAKHFPADQKITVAGKNFAGFDKLFIEKLPHGKHFLTKFEHRVIDPGPMYLRKGDNKVPNLQMCLERAGIREEVTHTACYDAYQVIKVVRKALK